MLPGAASPLKVEALADGAGGVETGEEPVVAATLLEALPLDVIVMVVS